MAKTVRSPGDLGPKELPKVAPLLRNISIVILVAVLVGAYAFSYRAFEGSESDGDLPITDQLSDIKGRIDQSEWQLLSTRQRMRCDLVEVRQKVELIWKDIDELDTETARFNEVYSDVYTSKRYPELLKDEFAVRCFAKDIKDPLPRVETSRHCGERLNVLMYTVNRALAKKRAAYEIEYQTRDRIDSIEHDVRKALDAYLLHREFVEALRALTAAGALPEAETMREAAHKLRLQSALEKMGHPDALREKYRPKPQGAAKRKGRRTASIDDEVGSLVTKDGK